MSQHSDATASADRKAISKLARILQSRPVDPTIVTWLVDTGYGSDYTLKEPIPENYRWSLAREYSRRTIQDGGLVPEESPEHWYALLSLALGWESSDE